jgi:hypothetical protein
LKRKQLVPRRPFQLRPNMRANPEIQNMGLAMQKSMRFLIATLMLFFERTRPVSRQQNPACMSMTSAVATMSHTRSTGVEVDCIGYFTAWATLQEEYLREAGQRGHGPF